MKLMIANSDGRVLNWGQPPWANEADLDDYAIVDVDERGDKLPATPRDYRYADGKFIHDPLPKRRSFVEDVRADLQAATTIGQVKAALGKLLDGLDGGRQDLRA